MADAVTSSSLVQQANALGDQEESRYVNEVMDSFRQYTTFARYSRVGRSIRILNLPEIQRKVLPESLIPSTPAAQKRERIMQEAELRNQFFFDSMLRHAGMQNSQDILTGSSSTSSPCDILKGSGWAKDDVMSKVSSVLKSLMRDWSKEGISERQKAYDAIISAVQKYAPIGESRQIELPRVCVPGAGKYQTFFVRKYYEVKLKIQA